MANASLQDQRVIVIGGSSGIGFAVARAALAQGAAVVIGSRDDGKLDGGTVAPWRRGRGGDGGRR